MAESELIRSDRDRQQLRAVLLEGLKSPPAVMADAAYFETLRAGVDRYSKADAEGVNPDVTAERRHLA